MPLNDIQAFLRENAARLRRLGDRKDTSLGFNAFALVSDTYYRENFHSDIIRAILDPNSGHGEGALFLRKFVDFISAEARTDLAEKLRGLVVDDAVEVVREEGRVDVKIKAPRWTIIVENKINGAGDMERQIPRYVEKCRANGEDVVAVVYITAAEKKFPSEDGWKPDDRETLVEPYLVSVIGFSETKSIRNLAEDWIGPCALAARGFHAKAILEQYAELLRHQSGETMDQNAILDLLKCFGTSETSFTSLRRALSEAPKAVATHINRYFDGAKDKYGLSATGLAAKGSTVCYLELTNLFLEKETIQLRIDIRCHELETCGISFFVLNRDGWNEAFLQCINQCQSFDDYKTDTSQQFHIGTSDNTNRVVLGINADKAFANVDGFKDAIGSFLTILNKNNNKKTLRSICEKKLAMEVQDAGS